MKIKVMIVDDEYIILDGMASFPWNEYECELVATAQNDGKDWKKRLNAARILFLRILKCRRWMGLSLLLRLGR